MELQPLNQTQEKQPRHGQAPADELENGPAEDRNCTDFICCILYIAACVAMVVIGSIGFAKGHPERLTYPYDPDDNACGLSDKVIDYPYIYLASPFPDYFNRSVCVKKCPYWVNSSDKPKELECMKNKIIESCEENYDYYSAIQADIDSFANNSFIIYNTSSLFGRFCIPSQHPFDEYAKSVLDFSFLAEAQADIELTWPIILASSGIALVIAFVYMVIMRYCSGIITWLAIFLYFALVIFLGFYFFFKHQHYNDLAAKDENVSEENNPNKSKANFMLALAIVFWTIAGVSFIIFVCSIKRIRLAIAIIKSAAIFIKDVPSALIVPLIFGLLLIGFLAFWICIFIYVYAIGDIKGSKNSPFASIERSKEADYMLQYEVFALLWTCALIQAMCQFILASSCSIWYFSQGTGQEVFSPVLRSFKRAIFYHLGSLAFGSLILAIVQFLRLMLESVHRQMQASGANQNQAIGFLVKCLRCFGECFERFIAFLNKNAYIQISITGKSFCPAAKDAFWLIYKNPGKFAIVNGIGHVFIAIGKYFIAISTTVCCYFILTSVDTYVEVLFSVFIPILFCFLMALLVGHIFMEVYGMGIDTILQCYCLDEELQKKKNRPAAHCPEPLKQFFDSQEHH